MLFFGAQTVYGVAQLYYIEDWVAPLHGQRFFAVASALATLVGLLVALPAGAFIERLGAMRVSASVSVGGALVFLALPYVREPANMTALICANTVLYQLIQAAVIPVISLAVPDQDHFARDIGGVMAAQGIGGACAAIFAGPWLDFVFPRVPHAAPRDRYALVGYEILYGLQALGCALSALLSCVAAQIVRARERAAANGHGEPVLL
mmetsp:Transcript_67505/g.185093  ORF Transcript_67505/g.185093 Transcript_67505/m.185093 type:complete len:207 (+) Transcript_67505:155-775(+)